MTLLHMNICCLLILQTSIIISMASGDLSRMPEVKDMAISNTQFTIDLLRQLRADVKDKNVFFAPYSISTALGMTYLGARGTTAEEMKKVLRWSSDIPKNGYGSYLPLLKEAGAAEARGYILVGAQRIYLNERLKLKPDFGSETQKYFSSQAVTSNFAGNAEGERKKINSWVSEQTREKISDLLPPGSLDSLTAMVLVQALYFKGNWMHKFDANKTRPGDFFTPQGKVQVNMMQQTRDFNFGVSKELDCTAVELPYSSNTSARTHDLSMLILLPNARDGLEKLETALTVDALQKLRSTMDSIKVELTLPRFSVESMFELKKVLSSLGMPEAFKERADFSGMVDEDLSISEVYHKAVVEVNEEGSEAAAATAVVMMSRCMPMTEPFVADHPFLFFIIDKRADVVLFTGRLVNPATEAQLKTSK